MLRNISLKLTFVLTVILASCSNNNNDALTNEAILELTNSSAIFDNHCKDIIMSLKERGKQFRYKEKVEMWQPIAEKAIDLTNNLQQFLLSNENFDSTTNRIKSTQKLYNKLIEYKNNLVELNPRIKEDLNSVLQITQTRKDTAELAFSEFDKQHSKQNAKLFNAILINKVMRFRNYVVEYCNINTTINYCGYDHFQAIAVQNSTHFKPNEKLKITAGIGVFSSNAQPIVKVDSKTVKLNTEGVAEYETKVADKPGTYSKLVTIEFTKPDGTRSTIEKQIKYTVDE